MNFSLKQYGSTKLPPTFSKLAKDDRHRGFIKHLSTSCQKGDSVVYLLLADGNICGFVGLSAGRVDAIPCLNIDLQKMGSNRQIQLPLNKK